MPQSSKLKMIRVLGAKSSRRWDPEGEEVGAVGARIDAGGHASGIGTDFES